MIESSKNSDRFAIILPRNSVQVRSSKSFPSPADAPSLSPQYHERKNTIVSSTSHVVFPSPEERARSLLRATSKQGSQEFEPVSKNGARESKWSDIDKWNDAGSERGISAQALDRVRNVWETGHRRLSSPSADNAAFYEAKLSEDTHTSTRAHTRTPEDVHTRTLDHSIVLQNFSQAAETREDCLSFDGASESIDRDSAEVGERGGGGRRARARNFEEEEEEAVAGEGEEEEEADISDTGDGKGIVRVDTHSDNMNSLNSQDLATNVAELCQQVCVRCVYVCVCVYVCM